MPAQAHRTADHLFHDLVGAAVDALHPRVGPGACDRHRPPIGVRAVRLHTLVDDPALQAAAPVLGQRPTSSRLVPLAPASGSVLATTITRSACQPLVMKVLLPFSR
jgi:hypothetical protein